MYYVALEGMQLVSKGAWILVHYNWKRETEECVCVCVGGRVGSELTENGGNHPNTTDEAFYIGVRTSRHAWILWVFVE